MNKQKLFKLLLLFICLMMIVSMFALPIAADVGNTFSGGGDDFGGGSSFYGGGSSGMDLSFLLYMLLDNPVLLIIVIVVLIIFSAANKKNTTNTRKVTSGHNSYSNPGFKSNSGIYEDVVVAKIKENDPNFNKEDFKAYANEVWLTLQEAWEKKDWKVVRPFESNSLFVVHERQLKEYIDNKTTNYMNKQNIRSTLIANYREDGEYEVVHVKLDASLLDFTLDDETMKVIEGSQDEYVHRSYKLEFIRTKQVTKKQEGTNVTNCPNCGAPTNVTSSGQCEYCKSVITNGEFGWVLNKYEAWN